MIGKLGASGSYATLYIYSTETFPTVVRNTALGLCAISETVGYFVSPYIVNLVGTLVYLFIYLADESALLILKESGTSIVILFSRPSLVDTR